MEVMTGKYRKFDKWCKENKKYPITSLRDVQIEHKRIDRNNKEKVSREAKKTAESVVREIKELGGNKRRIGWM